MQQRPKSTQFATNSFNSFKTDQAFVQYQYELEHIDFPYNIASDEIIDSKFTNGLSVAFWRLTAVSNKKNLDSKNYFKIFFFYTDSSGSTSSGFWSQEGNLRGYGWRDCDDVVKDNRTAFYYFLLETFKDRAVEFFSSYVFFKYL